MSKTKPNQSEINKRFFDLSRITQKNPEIWLRHKLIEECLELANELILEDTKFKVVPHNIYSEMADVTNTMALFIKVRKDLNHKAFRQTLQLKRKLRL